MQKKFTLFSSCIKECRSSFVMILLEYSSTDNLMLSTVVPRKEPVWPCLPALWHVDFHKKKVAELCLNQQYSPEQNRSGLVLLNLYICRWCGYFLFIFSVMSCHVRFVHLTFLKKKKKDIAGSSYGNDSAVKQKHTEIEERNVQTSVRLIGNNCPLVLLNTAEKNGKRKLGLIQRYRNWTLTLTKKTVCLSNAKCKSKRFHSVHVC